MTAVRTIGRIDGAAGARVVVAVPEGGGGVQLELALDGTVMRMRLAPDQAAALERLIGLALFRCWLPAKGEPRREAHRE